MANEENLIPFKKGQSGNPNGRPRKSFSTINAELKKKGVTPLTKNDLIEAYQIIFNATDPELTEISKDKNTPLAFRLIIGELKNKSTRTKALQDLRDYMFGTAKQNVDHTSGGKPITDHKVSINFVKPKE